MLGFSAVSEYPLGLSAQAGSTADTAPPVLSGNIAITAITPSGFTISYGAATDNVAVAGYDISVDTGTASYASVGNVLSVDRTELNPSTTYTVRVRAYDAANNKSNVLTTTVTTADPVFVDDENPVIPGTLTISATNSGGFTVAWQAGSDNVGIAGYEVSADTGVPSYAAAGLSLSKVVAGLLPSTTYNVRVRAIDPSGNFSNSLTTTATTSAQVVASEIPVISRGGEGVVLRTLSALSATALSLAYTKNTAQELVLYNKGGSAVIVNIRGSEATVVTVKGAAGKTLDLSIGLNITCPAGQFTTLKLDSAVAYLKGTVTVTASASGAVFAGALQ